MNNATCLICSSVSIRMVDILNTHLQAMYEKLTDLKLHNELRYLCFICNRRLQQCYQLQKLANNQIHMRLCNNNSKNQNIYTPHNSVITLSISNVSNVTIPYKPVLVPEIKTLNVKQEVDEDTVITPTFLEVTMPYKSEKLADNIRLNIKQEVDNEDVGVTDSEQDTFDNLHVQEIKIEYESSDSLSLQSRNTNYADIENDTIDKNKCVGSANKYVHYTNLHEANTDHLILTKGINIKLYKCKYCSYVNNTKSNVLSHELSHDSCKSYSCDICKKTFSKKHILTRHANTHTGDKPYRCDVCNKTFSIRSNLIRHKRSHTGDRPYGCDVCIKTFSDKSNLIKHQRIHTGDKPYGCDVCNKTFSDSSYLITHKRTHTGDRPYGCDVCNKTFAQSNHLKTHKKIHNLCH